LFMTGYLRRLLRVRSAAIKGEAERIAGMNEGERIAADKTGA